MAFVFAGPLIDSSTGLLPFTPGYVGDSCFMIPGSNIASLVPPTTPYVYYVRGSGNNATAQVYRIDTTTNQIVGSISIPAPWSFSPPVIDAAGFIYVCWTADFNHSGWINTTSSPARS